MKSLIVYDSLFGNTQKVAEEIAKIIKGKAVNVKDFKKDMLKDFSLLIVGTPIQAWNPSKPTSEFLSLLPNLKKGIKVAAFETRINIFFSGSAADKVNKQLVKLGGKSVSEPGKFVVKGKEGPLKEGELEKAKDWAKQILEKIND